MTHFNFIAGNNFDLNNFKDIELFADNYPDFQTVTLRDEGELKILFELMGINEFIYHEINNSEFIRYWDVSNFRLPELDEEQFDDFYKNWISKSQRENNMDEFGNLIFLQGLSLKWNKVKYRMVVEESPSYS
jgi:hypothetical protein